MDLTVAIHVKINPGPNNVTPHCQGPGQGQRSVSQVSGTLEHTVVSSLYADYANFASGISTC